MFQLWGSIIREKNIYANTEKKSKFVVMLKRVIKPQIIVSRF